MPAPAQQTGLLFDDIYLRHLAGNTDHPERPERLIAIRDELERTGVLKTLYRITPRRVTDQELELVHKPSYVALVRRELSAVRGFKELSTGDTVVSADSLRAAEFAAGGVLNVVDAVMAGKVRNAFAAVRPPGHHATPDRGMGFCIFNNVAIAARYLQKKHGIGRVLIVDWDYHHGNGTQDIFYNDGSVFYFSTHHYGAYPGTGSAAETGRGPGVGKILNVPRLLVRVTRNSFRLLKEDWFRPLVTSNPISSSSAPASTACATTCLACSILPRKVSLP